MKTTNVDKNLGPASIIIVNGEKDLQVKCGMIMGKEDVLDNPLKFPTEAEVHTCEYDAKKGISRRKYDRKIEEANFIIMTEERNTRKQQGRDINVVPEMPQITGQYNGTIAKNGEIIRNTVDSER